jgi:uncharacterized membrane protein (DUF485 family)
LVLRTALRNGANPCFSSAVRCQPRFPAKTVAGSIGDVVDAASNETEQQRQLLAILASFSYASRLICRHVRKSSMETKSNPLGMTLFCIYSAIYAGFVLINALYPELMEWTPLAGLNLAILYGFALIIIAFVLSLLYGFLAARREKKADSSDEGAAA